MPDEATTDNERTAAEDDNKVFVLLYRSESLTDFDQLEDPESVASQVARGRGQGVIVQSGGGASQHVRTDGGATVQQNNNYDCAMQFQNGQIKSDTGYMMRFINKEHRDLSVFDVVSLPHRQSYPVPQATLDSLPVQLRSQLEHYGSLKIRGTYDRKRSRFYGIEEGWDTDEAIDDDLLDELPDLIQKFNSTQIAVDYLFVNRGSDEWGIDEVAELRGVKPDAVKHNLRRAQNRTND